MNSASSRVRLLCICFVMAFLASLAFAQSSAPAPRITRAIDESTRTTLAGTTPAAIKTAHDLGAVENGHSLQRMMLVLKPSPAQQASLNSLIENQNKKGSANYHKWLTPAQFAAQFGPSDDDLAKVNTWLQSWGLKPTAVSKGRQWIEFSGTAQQVNSAFHTSMHQFEQNGQTHIANSSEISIPQALTPVVSGVLSLNDFHKQANHSKLQVMKRNAEGKGVPVNPEFTNTDGNGNYYYYLAPADFQKIYNESPLLKSGVNGAGVSIAVVGRSDISLADVQAFRSIFGLPENDPNIILNGTDPGYPNNGQDQVESTLDLEWAAAAAPGATINLVESANTDTTDGIDLSSAYIVDNVLSPIISISYGQCEPLMGPAGNAFYNALWQQAAAEGITVFASTGDGGAAECDGELQNAGQEPEGPALHDPSVSGVASTPYNVAVGGTQFNEGSNYTTYWQPNNGSAFDSALGYIPEQAWNQSCDPTLPQTGTNCASGETWYILTGGGGGSSNCTQASIDNQGNETCLSGYAKPSWQTGNGVPQDSARDIPDVSLTASGEQDPYLVCITGSCQTQTLNGQSVLATWGSIGGTSASAPSMAGIMALVEQKNGAFQGQANYLFYRLAAMDKASSCDSSTLIDPTQPSSCNFNDITMGSNSDPGLPGYGTSTAEWSAGPGYDMATGLGTVNAANLVANWSSATSSAGSTTTLTVDSATLTHGQPATIHIHVAPAAGTSSVPTGDVALVTDKFGDAGSVTIDGSGNYDGPVSNLPGGTYNLTARYAGDGTFASSTSAPVPLTVAPESSVVTVSLSVADPATNSVIPYAGTAQYAAPFYFSVNVAGKSGKGLATGTVNILNGGKVVLSAPLSSSGTAYIETDDRTAYTFPVGTSNVSVQYVGDSSFSTSTSTPQNVTFQQQQIYTEVGISFYQLPAGSPVNLTASIPPGWGTTIPTGTFQFYDNGQPLGSALPIVNNGAAYANVTYTTTFTTVGTHNISVGYSGDSNFTAVSGTDPNHAYSSQFNVTPAAGAATVTTIVQTPATIAYGQSFTYTVKVAPAKAGGPVPTGNVLVTGTGNIFGYITLVNGQGSTTEQSDAGTAVVYAQYLGDSNYASSTSPKITTTILKNTPPVTLTTTAPYVQPGQQTSLNMTVTGFSFGQYGYNDPQGTVQFFTSVNGGQPQAIAPPSVLAATQSPLVLGVSMRAVLPAGTNVVTAIYSGDQDFNSVTAGPMTIVVTPPDFTVTSNPSALTVSAGGSTTGALTVSPILGFSGAISLSCAGGLPAGTTCNFSPSTLQAGGGQSNLTIAMQGPFTPQTASSKTGWAVATELGGVVGLFLVGIRTRRKWALAMMLVVMAAFGSLSGCGGGSSASSSTAVLVESSESKVVSGTAVTFTAQVSGGDKAATGSITFYDGSTALGNAASLTDGQATVQVSNLAVGTHSITAKYSGDSKHTASTSQPLYEAITGTTTLQVVASSGSVSHELDVQLAVQ